MFFSKLKKGDDEILPPPPPFPPLEFDENEGLGQPSAAPEPEANDGLVQKSPENSGQQEILKGFEEFVGQKPEVVKEKKASKKARKGVKIKGKKAIDKKSAEKAHEPAIEVTQQAPAFIEEQKIDFTDSESQHLEDSRQEIRDAISKIKEKEKPSFLKSLLSRMQDAPKNRNVNLINEKITAAKERLFRNDYEGAKRIYLDIMRFYNKCNKTEQAKIYSSIKELYEERKKAEQVISA